MRVGAPPAGKLGGKRGSSSKLADVAEGGVKRVEDLEAAAAAGPILLRVEEDFAWLVGLEPDEEEEEEEGEGRLGVEEDDLNRRAVAPITEDEAVNADGPCVINRKFEEERAEREDAGASLPPSWRVEGQAEQALREITGRSMLVALIKSFIFDFLPVRGKYCA